MPEIFTQIEPPVKPTQPLEPPKLSAEQEKMYQEVYDHFSKDDYMLPGIEENGQLQERELFWLSYECLLRFLRATKWKVPAAIQRLENTLKWRREFGIETAVTASHIEPEALTGKALLFGFDVHGRPAFYLIPSRQNTAESHRQIEFTFFMLERAIDIAPRGVESVALLIDFSDRGKNPSMNTSRTVLNILQDHYPERLGISLVAHVPYLVHLFFKLIMPFVDPVTRQKIKFNPDAVKDGLFAPDNIMSRSWGGSAEFVHDHEKYWPHLNRMAEERLSANFERWKKLGGKLGLKEWDYKNDGRSAEVPDASEKVEVPAPTLVLASDAEKADAPPLRPMEQPASKVETEGEITITTTPITAAG